jgi:hypothetical protein
LSQINNNHKLQHEIIDETNLSDIDVTNRRQSIATTVDCSDHVCLQLTLLIQSLLQYGSESDKESEKSEESEISDIFAEEND